MEQVRKAAGFAKEASAAEQPHAGRQEWFHRFQWAIELTASSDQAQRITGFNVLGALVLSPLASDASQPMT